jgi:hypothetical protein
VNPEALNNTLNTLYIALNQYCLPLLFDGFLYTYSKRRRFREQNPSQSEREEKPQKHKEHKES